MSFPKTDRPLVVGMVGVAGFGGYRRQRMRETGLFKLAACHDRNPDAMQQAQDQDGALPTDSLDALLATPGLEGLVISTGVDTHVPFAIRALEAGLHVFVEKPLCGRPEEVQQILDARERTGKVVALGHSDHATDWVYRLARQHLDDGTLGTLVAYEENSSHSGGLEIKPGDWRGLRDRNPGGMLLQCGVHALHRLNHQFGPIAEVAAMMRYDAHPATETADVASVLLRHTSGLVGTLNCYHVTAYCHELRLFGTKANLYIDTFERRAWIQRRQRGPREVREEVAVPASDPADACANLVNWYRAVREGAPAQPSLEDGIQAVLPVFAAELSDTQRRTVSLAELRKEVASPA